MNDEPERDIYTATRYMKAGYTGRLYEIAGGVQGLTRESKKVNWSGPDIYNYDIRSCVLAALSIFCDKLGINHKTIDNYVNNPDSKYEYATSIGVSVDCWKQSLISLIFGAKINRSGAPTVAIRNDVGRDNFDRVYNKFLEISEPIRFVISEWLSKVQHYSISMANSKGIIYNPVLCPLGLESLEFKKPGKLSAFFLQGLECKFIYNLILASKESTFQVLSYEFDGLITKGKIPQEVIEQARIDSGFNNVTLEIKDF